MARHPNVRFLHVPFCAIHSESDKVHCGGAQHMGPENDEKQDENTTLASKENVRHAVRVKRRNQVLFEDKESGSGPRRHQKHDRGDTVCRSRSMW